MTSRRPPSLILLVACGAGGALAAALDLLTPHGAVSVAGAALTAGAVALGLATRGRWRSLALTLGALGVGGLGAVRHDGWALLAGGLLGAGAGAAVFGLLGEVRPGLRARLRWLLWPQLALDLAITELAYLRCLPYRLLSWPGADKVLHFVLFGALAFWLELWLDGRDLGRGRLRVPLSLVLVLAPATGEEVLQLLSTSRTADLKDLLCDLAGILLAIWLARRIPSLAAAPGQPARPPAE